jgi:nucleoside-diphosphate kinase
LRGYIGPTNSNEAPAGTIRGDFGTDVQFNAVHASDSIDNAAIEIEFFFGE